MKNEYDMPTKHSAFGISSFILSMLTGIIIFVLVVIAGVLEVSTPGGINEESVEAVVLGLCILAALFGCLVAFGIGIAGLIQKDRKKIFSILGVIFSALSFIITVLLIIIGLTIDG